MNYLNLRFTQSTLFGITLISASCNNLVAMNRFLNKLTKTVATTISKNGNETIEELLSNGAQNDIATFYSRIINTKAAVCLDIFHDSGNYSDANYKNQSEEAVQYIKNRLAIAHDPRIIAILEDLAAKDTGDNLAKAVTNAFILHNTFLEDSLRNAMYMSKNPISDEERIALLNAHQKIMNRMQAHNTIYKQACYYCGYVGIDLRGLVRKTELLVGCAGTVYILYKLYTKYSNAHQSKQTA
jgi:hypothetical protein